MFRFKLFVARAQAHTNLFRRRVSIGLLAYNDVHIRICIGRQWLPVEKFLSFCGDLCARKFHSDAQTARKMIIIFLITKTEERRECVCLCIIILLRRWLIFELETTPSRVYRHRQNKYIYFCDRLSGSSDSRKFSSPNANVYTIVAKNMNLDFFLSCVGGCEREAPPPTHSSTHQSTVYTFRWQHHYSEITEAAFMRHN